MGTYTAIYPGLSERSLWDNVKQFPHKSCCHAWKKVIVFDYSTLTIKFYSLFYSQSCINFIKLRNGKFGRPDLRGSLFRPNKFTMPHLKFWEKYGYGSIHIWRQMFFVHFWPTYLPSSDTLLKKSLKVTKIRWSSTYLPTQKSDVIYECSHIL